MSNLKIKNVSAEEAQEQWIHWQTIQLKPFTISLGDYLRGDTM